MNLYLKCYHLVLYTYILYIYVLKAFSKPASNLTSDQLIICNETLCVDGPHDYESVYFEPANKEEELVAQIMKLGVAEISREGESCLRSVVSRNCFMIDMCYLLHLMVNAY